MNKKEFLSQLAQALSAFPKEDAEKSLEFYSEMIDDRIEDGMTEEEAVTTLGTVEQITEQLMADTPFLKIAKERMKPQRHLKLWEIILLVLGAPIWLSLLIAVAAVAIAVYVSCWAVIISVWAVVVAVVACALYGVVIGIGYTVKSSVLPGAAMIGAGLVCAGLAILLIYGSKAVTKGTLRFTGKLALWCKTRFIRKEAAQ